MSEVLEELAIMAASLEIAEYSPVEAGLADLRSRLANVTYDLTTVKGMAVAKADRAEVRSLRTGLEAKRKAIKAPALAHCKLIDAEASRITAELLKLEEPIDQQIKRRESELEAERAARELAERTRIMAITERIAGIRQYVELAASCRTSERMQALQDKLAEYKLEGFEEYETDAELAWKQTCAKVEELLNDKLAQEAEQARIKQEQADAAAKLAAERAEFEAAQAAAKLKAEQDAAAAKAEADRLAAEQAAQAARRLADIAAEVEAQAAARKAAQAELDRQRAELETASAVALAAAESQRAALAAERAEFEAQQAAAKQAAEQAEADRIEALRETEAPVVKVVQELDELPLPISLLEPAATDDAREETAMWKAITNAEPSDADLMWLCISAVAKEYSWTTEQATTRLAAVNWNL